MAAFPPRLPAESAQAYESACTYVSMGADRSQEAVGRKLGKSRQLMSRWSAQHDWVQRAALYDAALAAEAAARYTADYLAKLEDHRTRYENAGKALYRVSSRLLKMLDGQVDELELTPATLGVVLRAFITAADLEAHALMLDEVLPSLGRGGDR